GGGGGKGGEPAVRARAAVEVQPDVQLLFRHASVEEVAQAVGVPAEPRVHAARDVHVAVEHHSVLLAVADAGAITDQPQDRREARVAHEGMDPLGEHRGERESLETWLASLLAAAE